MIEEFTIFGERCSGTNFLQKVVETNFSCSFKEAFGWKHGIGWESDSIPDDYPVLGIVRNPYDWFSSLRETPHHLVAEMKKDWDSFLTHEVCSRRGHWQSNRFTSEIIEDRNPDTKERFPNLLALRKWKLEYLLTRLPRKCKRYHLLRYEGLRDSPEQTIRSMCLALKLRCPPRSRPLPGTSVPAARSKGSSRGRNVRFLRP